LKVGEANEALVLISAATDYQGFAGRQTKDPLAATLQDMNRAAIKSFESLRKAQIADYQKYFKRVSLYLKPADAEAAAKPTPERILLAKKDGGDPGLASGHERGDELLAGGGLQFVGADPAAFCLD
jgi:alpha-L-fucosidase 2